MARTCSVCPEPHEAKGYCVIHYRHWRRHGDALAPKLRVRGRKCRVCGGPHEAKGLCKLHYERDKAGYVQQSRTVASPQTPEAPIQTRKEYLDALWEEIKAKRAAAAQQDESAA